MGDDWILLGGAGFIGGRLATRLVEEGHHVTVVDRNEPRGPVSWLAADLLLDEVTLPPGPVVLALGAATPRPRRSWMLAQLNGIATARVLPELRDREVTLLSSGEVYGSTEGDLQESSPIQLGVDERLLEDWVEAAKDAAKDVSPPWRTFPLCKQLVDLDPTGRWAYALSKRAQELMVQREVRDLRILRLGDVFGRGQERVVSTWVRRILFDSELDVTPSVRRSFIAVDEVVRVIMAALPFDTYNVGGVSLDLTYVAKILMEELERQVRVRYAPPILPDHSGQLDCSKLRALVADLEDVETSLRSFARDLRRDLPRAFPVPLRGVIPPRPEDPATLVGRHYAVLETGMLKHNVWTRTLEQALGQILELPPEAQLILTNSGTSALRLAVATCVERRRETPVAVIPSFTFPATGEFLLQLGYELVFVDVDQDTWTMDPQSVERALGAWGADVVVSVDALGNPAPYKELSAICSDSGIPLIADSAPGIGACYGGRPVGTQVPVHAFSLSFAKLISAGCDGGALVVPAGTDLETGGNWLRSSLMSETSALVVLDQLDHFDELLERRRSIAAVYGSLCERLDGLVPQRIRSGDSPSLAHWGARVSAPHDRDLIQRRLLADGIQSKPYYSPGLHELLPGRLAPGGLPVTEQLKREVLAMPMSSEMTIEEARLVAACVVAAFKTGS